MSDKEYIFTYFPPINSIVFLCKYSYCMGSNASKSTSAYSVCNYSTILRSGAAHKKLKIINDDQ